MKPKVHFHLRRKEGVIPGNLYGIKIPAGEKSAKIYKTRDEADKALFETYAKWPDLDGRVEVVPCVERCKGLEES